MDLRKIVAEKLFNRFGQRNIKSPASLPRSVNEFCEQFALAGAEHSRPIAASGGDRAGKRHEVGDAFY